LCGFFFYGLSPTLTMSWSLGMAENPIHFDSICAFIKACCNSPKLWGYGGLLLTPNDKPFPYEDINTLGAGGTSMLQPATLKALTISSANCFCSSSPVAYSIFIFVPQSCFSAGRMIPNCSALMLLFCGLILTVFALITVPAVMPPFWSIEITLFGALICGVLGSSEDVGIFPVFLRSVTLRKGGGEGECLTSALGKTLFLSCFCG